jgi:hypothetical protein
MNLVTPALDGFLTFGLGAGPVAGPTRLAAPVVTATAIDPTRTPVRVTTGLPVPDRTGVTPAPGLPVPARTPVQPH